jgi:hypothetical protein
VSTRASRARSYTARLQERTAAPKRPKRPRTPEPAPLIAGAAIAVELGHLAAAFVEWPQAAPRGLLHVLVAAALGLVAVSVYFGPSRPWLALGITVAVASPLAWLAGGLAGLSPYRDFPVVAAVALTVAEAGLAVLLTFHVRQADARG